MPTRSKREFGRKQDGENQANKEINRTSEVRKTAGRTFQHGACEEPRTIESWFRRVHSLKKKYNIHDEDIYSFDEVEFVMGKKLPQLPFTNTGGPGGKKRPHPGKREWFTVVQGISATGWAIPPYIIFPSWEHKVSIINSIPLDWDTDVSHNGRMLKESAIDWLEHFDEHTKSRKKRKYRLLIMDNHESHVAPKFRIHCNVKNIITIFLPKKLSHFLQPLDVGCLSLLQKAYSDEILNANDPTQDIAKEAFLSAIKLALNQALTKGNICAGFRDAGLVPHDPQIVLSMLAVKLRKSTPPPQDAPILEAEISINPHEMMDRAKNIREHSQQRIRLGSANRSLHEKLVKACNSVEQNALELLSLRRQLVRLLNSDVDKKRKSKKRNYDLTQIDVTTRIGRTTRTDGTTQIDMTTWADGNVRIAGPTRVDGIKTITLDDVAEMIAPEETGRQRDSNKPTKRARRKRHCGNCGEPGHNVRTCKISI